MKIETPHNAVEKEKPPFLYHGSPHGQIDEFEPRQKSVRDPNEGPRIFATPELSLATIFMSEQKISESGKFDDIPYAVIVGSKEAFIAKDKGGHVYVLPSDKFKTDPDKGLGENEWTSEERVKPIKKLEFKSTLDAMLENGVQVYFVDEGTNRKIKKSADHGLSILSNLKSENELRGINARLLHE